MISPQRYLSRYGIDMSKRPDVVRKELCTAIPSSMDSSQRPMQSLQPRSAIPAVTVNFFVLLYYYRMKQYPAYVSRYRSEYAQALSLLRKAA